MLTTIKRTAFKVRRFVNKKWLTSAPIDTFRFPPEFDAHIYKKSYRDVIKYSHKDLYTHYLNQGLNEGRRANILKTRFDFIELIPKDKKVLEIGPFWNPSIFGEKVFYFDIQDKEELMLKAKSFKLPVKNCPYIHFVSPTGNLDIVNECFDVVLSSHCIEHQPNLLKHLNNVEKLLNPGGYYFVLAPDKRYCFDHFIPESSLAQVIETQIENKGFHSLRTFLENGSLTTHNEQLRHWKGDHGNPLLSIKERVEDSLTRYNKSLASKEYVDLHTWYFTPNSFKNIIDGLNAVSYTRLTIEKIYPTLYGSNEFWAILKKS
jgi:SAM-dependent methyltransferase